MRWIINGTKSDGSPVKGTLEAVSDQHAIERLSQKGITVVSIKQWSASSSTETSAPLRDGPATRMGGQAAAPTAPPPGGLVFISHSSSNKAIAFEIARALENAGAQCWIAPRDIPAGSDWNHHIMTALRECSVFVLLYSHHSVDSEPVKREVERAVSRSVPIVPIRLEETPPSPSLEFLISTYQWINAYPPPVSRHMDQIVVGVQRALGVAAVTPSRGPSSGDMKFVGRYRIMEQIGEGGAGTVYKAEQRDPVKRIVALKLVKAGFDTAEVIARFASERQALARMNHPNIAKVLDAGQTEQGRPYFVMEHVPGMPITQFADSYKLSIRQRLELFLQVCDAIAHAHSKSILHRDIKAGNVLASMHEDKPIAKVIDFGIAKALVGESLTDHTVNTSHGMVVGTYACMSPEQAEGSPDLDTRSDVYSLGVLLYELLSGAKPFEPETLKNATEEEVRRIIREVQPPRPSTRLTSLGKAAEQAALVRQSRMDSLRRDLNGELGWIPLMAMRKERQRRYASPLLMAEDIQNYLHARPLIAGPESQIYKFKKFVRRNRLMLSAALIVLTASSTGVGVYIRDISKAERRTELALAEANKHQRIALQVNSFLADILNSADPKKGFNTIAQAIDESSRRLDAGDVDDQPQVAASIRDTIGDAYRAMANYDSADANLTKALAQYRGFLAGAPDDAQVAKILDHQAHLWKDRLKYSKPLPTKEEAKKMFDQALKLYNNALEIYHRTVADDDPAIADTLANRASLLMTDLSPANLASAEGDYREALRIRQKNVTLHKLEPDSEPMLQSKSAIISVLAAQHHFAEAKTQSVEVIHLAERSRLGPNSTAVARAYLGYGDVLQAEAEQFQEEAKQLQAKDPEAAETNFDSAESNLKKAAEQFEKALEIDKIALAKHLDHPYFKNCQDKIAKCNKKLTEVQHAKTKHANAEAAATQPEK